MTFPWKKLCVPVDFSDASRASLGLAVELACGLGAELLLVFVQAPPILPLEGPPLSQEILDRLDAEAAQVIASWSREAQRLGAPRVTQMMASGTPAETILHVARDQRCDVIVIGTHGRTALRHVLLGSVAERVVRHADRPVLTLRSVPPPHG